MTTITKKTMLLKAETRIDRITSERGDNILVNGKPITVIGKKLNEVTFAVLKHQIPGGQVVSRGLDPFTVEDDGTKLVFAAMPEIAEYVEGTPVEIDFVVDAETTLSVDNLAYAAA